MAEPTKRKGISFPVPTGRDNQPALILKKREGVKFPVPSGQIIPANPDGAKRKGITFPVPDRTKKCED